MNKGNSSHLYAPFPGYIFVGIDKQNTTTTPVKIVIHVVRTRVVVIDFWDGFIDCNYSEPESSINNCPLQLPRLLTSNDYKYRKMTKLQITLLNYRSK